MPAKKIKPVGKVKEPLKYDPATHSLEWALDQWTKETVVVHKEIPPEEKEAKIKENAESLIAIGEKKAIYPADILELMKSDFKNGDYQAVIDLSFACDYLTRQDKKANAPKAIELIFKHKKNLANRNPKKLTRFTGIQVPEEDL